MSRTRRRFNPHGQGSLFDFPEPPPASSCEIRESAEMDLMSMATRFDVVSEAMARVKANRGAPGIDGMTVDELDAFWVAHGERICQVLREGAYVPRPVRRVTIPKPGGGERLLGIPTVVDRLVQQMLLTVLEPLFEPHFSDSSFGFRPGRSQHGAVLRSKEFVASGLDWVADIDLEKFFDRVNHDVLMSRLARRVTDKRMLKLLRRFLNVGAMVDGVVIETQEGTPQGGPLSPLLANVLLDDLDKELERRGHRFVRYADDCNIYVGSEEAAKRVLETTSRFVEVKLRLRVNRAKSAAARSSERRFLGFTLVPEGSWGRIRISDKSIARFKDEIRRRTSRRWRISGSAFLHQLDRYVASWANYYVVFEGCKRQLEELDAWIRRRIRQWLWVQWKTTRNRRLNLIRGGVWKSKAILATGTRSYWKAASGQAMSYCVNNQRIRAGGFIPLLDHWRRLATL